MMAADPTMAIEALEIRMARLEGAYEQINERLGSVERELGGLRVELKAEIEAMRSAITSEIGDIRRKMDSQFYWVLPFVLGAILFPILRELVVVR